jgi:hypothetical protein
MHTTAKRRIKGDKAMEQQIKFIYGDVTPIDEIY